MSTNTSGAPVVQSVRVTSTGQILPQTGGVINIITGTPIEVQFWVNDPDERGNISASSLNLPEGAILTYELINGTTNRLLATLRWTPDSNSPDSGSSSSPTRPGPTVPTVPTTLTTPATLTIPTVPTTPTAFTAPSIPILPTAPTAATAATAPAAPLTPTVPTHPTAPTASSAPPTSPTPAAQTTYDNSPSTAVPTFAAATAPPPFIATPPPFTAASQSTSTIPTYTDSLAFQP
ncbi:hypothetical protein PLESTM_001411800 [Pleodorina starrii]|nr:hypothetical protein PLESTM_001411800 [Pleodorina starrii]